MDYTAVKIARQGQVDLTVKDFDAAIAAQRQVQADTAFRLAAQYCAVHEADREDSPFDKTTEQETMQKVFSEFGHQTERLAKLIGWRSAQVAEDAEEAEEKK